MSTRQRYRLFRVADDWRRSAASAKGGERAPGSQRAASRLIRSQLGRERWLRRRRVVRQSHSNLTRKVQAVDVPRYRVVVEVVLHDRLEPLARLCQRIMQAPSKLLPELPQLRSQALADRRAFDGKVPVPVFPADMRESQKVERLGLPFTSSFRFVSA